MSHLRAFSAVALVLFGCSTFDAADPPPGDGGASVDASGDDAGSGDAGGGDAKSDAPACVPQAPPDALFCGTDRCRLGEQCCLADARCFRQDQTTCNSTQLNCTSRVDCANGDQCCNVGNSVGTRCLSRCDQGRAVVCRTHDECGPNELCMPPENAEQPWWSCRPCPP